MRSLGIKMMEGPPWGHVILHKWPEMPFQGVGPAGAKARRLGIGKSSVYKEKYSNRRAEDKFETEAGQDQETNGVQAAFKVELGASFGF